MNDQEKRVYREGYDFTYWEEKALKVSDLVTPEECEVWANHPCTKMLTYALQADVAGVVQGWLHGMYSNGDSIDDTSQMQAKARGMAQACDNTVETIGKIAKGKFGEE
jgi:hypothetical protein